METALKESVEQGTKALSDQVRQQGTQALSEQSVEQAMKEATEAATEKALKKLEVDKVTDDLVSGMLGIEKRSGAKAFKSAAAKEVDNISLMGKSSKELTEQLQKTLGAIH